MREPALRAQRAHEEGTCGLQLANLHRANAKKYLYWLYAERVALEESLPFDCRRDGVTHFETK